MYCIKCGKRNPEGASFCKHCGVAIPRDDEETQPLDAGPSAAEPADAHAELAAAIAECQGAIAADPSNRDAHALLSTLYEKAGDLDAAVTEREKVVELAPGSAVDRDKLAALRLVAAQRRKAERRRRGPSLLDTPAGAAAAAVAVTILVLCAGAGIVWVRAQNAPQRRVRQPQPVVATPAYQPPPGPRVLVNPGGLVKPQASAAPQPAAAPQRQTQQAPPRANPDLSGMAPARVNTPQAPLLANDPRYQVSQPPADASTVHLRDNGAQAAQAPAAAAPGAANRGLPPTDPGRIEIVIANPDSTAGTTPPKDANSPAQQSQAKRAYAQQQQLLGNYKQAIASYRQALDGAGDDAPAIQEQIALCYQNLKDRKNAAAAYNAMIAGYEAQIAAGRHVEAAKQGIKAAQLGLKAIQGGAQ